MTKPEKAAYSFSGQQIYLGYVTRGMGESPKFFFRNLTKEEKI